ncbi:MAG: GerAB/ArcD/ProY family transporter [Clostridia bacterium]|nr:GerAB/ArcD/ProY family transporter [Clostridia bacterium]
MEDTKIGSKEAIALLVTIAFNHIIMNITKSIIDTTETASLINILYIGIISIIFTSIICYFLNKFPTLDLIDISEYLGGKLLKWIIGLLFVGYFIFFAAILLNMFSSCLEIIYFQLVKTIYIVGLFVIAAVVACTIRHNAIYRTNLIIFPLIIISTLFIFIADYRYLEFEKMYPILGNGFFTTFVAGLSNMFAFQGLAYIYFMPPKLKEPNKLKKVAITSIVLSCLFLLISVAIILFMFNGFVETDELLPLYSAVKYIEFGSFFQKLDSTFVLIWILAFVSYLSIALKFSSNILKKLTNIENESIFTYLLGIALFFLAIWQKNYAVSIFLADTVYKYAFFTLVIGISLLVLFSATIKQKIRKWFK